MHLLLMIVALRASAHSFDFASLITKAPPPAAANCQRRLSPRTDRLAQFEKPFPREGAAFRRTFRWTRIDEGGKRQLLGVPRRQQKDPPILVVVPLDREPTEAILIVTIHPRHPQLDRTLAREIEKLGRILCVAHRFPREEFGIRYPAGSLDIVLFETPSPNNTATLGQAMNFASTMAALCPVEDSRVGLRVVTD